MTAIPYSNRISIRDFLARRGIQPKYERNGYGMYLSPLREERTPSFKVTTCETSGTTSDWVKAAHYLPS